MQLCRARAGQLGGRVSPAEALPYLWSARRSARHVESVRPHEAVVQWQLEASRIRFARCAVVATPRSHEVGVGWQALAELSSAFSTPRRRPCGCPRPRLTDWQALAKIPFVPYPDV